MLQVNAFHNAVDENPEYRHTQDYQLQRLSLRSDGMIITRLSGFLGGLLGYFVQIGMPLLRNSRPSQIGLFVGAVLCAIQGLHLHLSAPTHNENTDAATTEDSDGFSYLNIIIACTMLGYAIELLAEQHVEPARPALR